MEKIFIVEDEENIKELISYTLRNEGFKTKGFDDSESFYAGIEEELADLVILDIMIPGDDGFEVLQKLRNNEKTKHIPVIMLTAKTSEFHKVKGLDMGADDYVSKPFSVVELISRVKAVLRRYNISQQEEEILLLGPITLNLSKRSVRVNQEDIELTFKEFELLQYLLENKGLVLTRDMIMQEVWGFDFQGESRTIDVHIRYLRQKLGSAGKMIQTIRNVGYKIGV